MEDVEVAGHKLKLWPLGNETDEFLKDLFTRYFSDLARPYFEFRKGVYDDLRTKMHSYFDGKIDDPPGQDYLFNNLTVVWNTYQYYGRLGEAQSFWQDILNLVLEWEQTRQKRIHKGSLFYFWSQTAILQGQFDKGFFLIHSAYEEDILTIGKNLPDTPAFKTISLDYSNKNNLLYKLVEDWASFLSGFIKSYQTVSGKNFSLDDFQNKFLKNPPDRETLFSFTYTLARFFDFDTQIPPTMIKGSFVSLFELNTLFDLVLVIDSLIYSSLVAPGPNDWGFKNLAKHLLIETGLTTDAGLTRIHLEEINSSSRNDFETTLKLLLDQKFAYHDGSLPSRLESDIGIALCVRNYSAHKIGSFLTIRDRYSELRQSLFNVLFLATDTLK